MEIPSPGASLLARHSGEQVVVLNKTGMGSFADGKSKAVPILI
jgi:hypothetical protein